MELDQRQRTALLHHVKKYGRVIPELFNRTQQTHFSAELLRATLTQIGNKGGVSKPRVVPDNQNATQSTQ